MYAKTDEECRFCPLTAGQKEIKGMGIDKPVVITPEKEVEALAIVRDEQYEPCKKYLEGIYH